MTPEQAMTFLEEYRQRCQCPTFSGRDYDIWGAAIQKVKELLGLTPKPVEPPKT